jgi:hypothetical protein
MQPLFSSPAVWRFAGGALGLAAAMALATPAAGASTGRDPIAAAQARAMLERADASLQARRLGLAHLQLSRARAWHPAAVRSAPAAQRIQQAWQRQNALAERGEAALQQRDMAELQQVVAALLVLDSRSPVALNLVLRHQAALADKGGAFTRVQWADWLARSGGGGAVRGR